MTPEEKELVAGLNEEGCGENCDILCRNAAAAIERLSADNSKLSASLLEETQERFGAEQELAALRKQIAEAQPVAWMTNDGRISSDPKSPERFGAHWNKPLYTHPAADAKDAERYRWIKQRLFGADWDWNNEGVSVILFKWPESASIGADLDAAIDAAMKGGA